MNKGRYSALLLVAKHIGHFSLVIIIDKCHEYYEIFGIVESIDNVVITIIWRDSSELIGVVSNLHNYLSRLSLPHTIDALGTVPEGKNDGIRIALHSNLDRAFLRAGVR